MDDHEEMVGVLLDLRPLVMVAGVVDGQGVEVKNVTHQRELVVAGGGDVDPDEGAIGEQGGNLRRGHLLRAFRRPGERLQHGPSDATACICMREAYPSTASVARPALLSSCGGGHA